MATSDKAKVDHMTSSHPLCALSGLVIEDDCPSVAYVVVRRRTGMKWSPLGFGYRGRQSGAHSMTEVMAGPTTDYTSKLVLKGLRRRNGITHAMPADIEPGEVGRLLVENRLRWDHAISSGVFEEHRIRVMRVRADVHDHLVADVAGTGLGQAITARIATVVDVLRRIAAIPRDARGKPLDEQGGMALVEKSTVALRELGPHWTLMSDNGALVGKPDEASLVEAMAGLCHFDAALGMIGSDWQPSRVAEEAPDLEIVARHYANVLGIIEGT